MRGPQEIETLFIYAILPQISLTFRVQVNFHGQNMTRESSIIGGSLAAALPVTDKYWFRQPHLLRLNLVLLVPLLSSSTFGFDGKNYEY